MTPAQQRMLGEIRAGLDRAARYDDESVAAPAWVRPRYDSGDFPTLAAARLAAVTAAWHEAGHAVAALAVGARFTSVSIRYRPAGPRPGSAGRVRGVAGAGDRGFVIDAAGQIAERLRDWTMPGSEAELARWLRGWRADGGDARRFRAGLPARFGRDEAAAWHYSAGVLTPRRLQVARLARALLITPRYLPYPVAAALAGDCPPAERQ
jgi:hypothetical protein